MENRGKEIRTLIINDLEELRYLKSLTLIEDFGFHDMRTPATERGSWVSSFPSCVYVKDVKFYAEFRYDFGMLTYLSLTPNIFEGKKLDCKADLYFKAIDESNSKERFQICSDVLRKMYNGTKMTAIQTEHRFVFYNPKNDEEPFSTGCHCLSDGKARVSDGTIWVDFLHSYPRE